MAGTGDARHAVVRHRAGQQEAGTDRVAEEAPVALVYNGVSHAVMMATPLDLEVFAVGFSLTEGIVADAADIRDVDIQAGAPGIEVKVEIAPRAFDALKQRRRTLEGRTGCGLCGIESLQQLDLQPPRMPAMAFEVSAHAIRRAVEALPRHQRLMQATGGVHAAAWCSGDGEIHHVFEDVGRHNALDKLIGHLAMNRLAMDQGFVVVSSRASYELVRKAARMNIPLLASISAPTTLAIQVAAAAGLRLLSFCREDGFVDYDATPGGAT